MILIRSNETQCRLRRSVKDGVFFNPDEKEVQKNFGKNDEQKNRCTWVKIRNLTEKKTMLNLFGVTGSSRWPEVSVLAMGQMADRNF